MMIHYIYDDDYEYIPVLFDERLNITIINASLLVFIFVNNLNVIHYNNPNKVWVISVMFDL